MSTHPLDELAAGTEPPPPTPPKIETPLVAEFEGFIAYLNRLLPRLGTTIAFLIAVGLFVFAVAWLCLSVCALCGLLKTAGGPAVAFAGLVLCAAALYALWHFRRYLP